MVTEFRTRTFPPGVSGHQLALHFICGGDSAAACFLSVDIEERSPTSFSRRSIWSLPDSDKAIGAAALASTSWNHKIIDLPASDKESQVIIKTLYMFEEAGGIGLDNIVYTSTKKCNPT